MLKVPIFKKIEIPYCNFFKEVILYNYTKEKEKNTKDTELMHKNAWRCKGDFCKSI